MEHVDPIHGLTADELLASDRLFALLTREIRDADEVSAIERAATAGPSREHAVGRATTVAAD